MIPNLIYDVGAHRGEDTDFYLKKGFDVVAVEANPELAAGLRARFVREIGDGRLTLIEAAVAEHDGTIDFYRSEANSVWGTIRADWARRETGEAARLTRISVRATTFTDILKAHGVPYYLKVDIEGADDLCLQALYAEPEKPNFISIESEKRSWQALRQEFVLFEKLGYRRFKLVDQALNPLQQAPIPPREGLAVEHRFSLGSSGLFGKELPGSWLTADEAIARYRRVFLTYKLLGDDSLARKVVHRLRSARKQARAALSALRGAAPGPAGGFGIGKNKVYDRLHQRFAAHWFDTHACRDE